MSTTTVTAAPPRTRTRGHWRPRLVCLAAFALATVWNVSPLAANYARASADPAHTTAYWADAVAYLHAHLSPSYRVEAVDTTGHWAAVYLPRADIPLARGWFRQDDFPQNKLLYSPVGTHAYLAWLRNLGVRYVVLTGAPVDYSARGEARLLVSGRSGLRPVFWTPTLTVYEVPLAQRIVTGPGAAGVVAFTQTQIDLQVARAGRYRLAVRYSPYFAATGACLSKTTDGMTLIHARRAGRLRLSFAVTPKRALAALAGSSSNCEEK